MHELPKDPDSTEEKQKPVVPRMVIKGDDISLMEPIDALDVEGTPGLAPSSSAASSAGISN